MSYPRFSDEGCDGYHPGEEQPAMHNDEPQKPVAIPESDGLISTLEYFGKYCLDRSNPYREAVLAAAALIARTADGAVEPAGDLVERLWDRGRYWIVGDDKSEADARLVDEAAAALTALQQRAETLERRVAELGAAEPDVAALVARLLGHYEHGIGSDDIEEAAAALSQVTRRADAAEASLAVCKEFNGNIGTALVEWTKRAESAEQRNREMREALEWYANPEIYKPHPHGLAFDDRDLSFRARAALADQPAGAQTEGGQ